MENIWFVYPGQPFIGEGMVNTILAFDNEPKDMPSPSPHEREKSQIAFAMIMIALESLVNTKLEELKSDSPKTVEGKALITLPKPDNNEAVITLWHELRILRNTITHSSFFEKSTPKNYISKATAKKVLTDFNLKFINTEKEITNLWSLCYNPLNISRYEALVAFTFFYWYGLKTGVWVSNNPLHSRWQDSRLKWEITNNWINDSKFYNYVDHGKDFKYLIAFLSGRLPTVQKEKFYQLSKEYLNLDMEKLYKQTREIDEILRTT